MGLRRNRSKSSIGLRPTTGDDRVTEFNIGDIMSKGNGSKGGGKGPANGPSTTGKPSGGGRGNNPAGGK